MNQSQFYYQNPNAPKPVRNHIGVAVVVRFQGKVLLEYRTDADLWAFIGGGLETGETFTECALREIREETGLTLAEGDLIYRKTYDDPSRIIVYPDGIALRSISVVFETVLTEEPQLICSSESRELKFFSVEELQSLPLAATHIPIMRDL